MMTGIARKSMLPTLVGLKPQVSAPAALRPSRRSFFSGGRGNAASTFGICALRSAQQTKVSGKCSRWKALKFGSMNARVSSTARSARKLKKITLSLSEIMPSRSQAIGSVISSGMPLR